VANIKKLWIEAFKSSWLYKVFKFMLNRKATDNVGEKLMKNGN